MSPVAGDITGEWADVYEGRSLGTFGDSGVPMALGTLEGGQLTWAHWEGAG